jgi:hypothetical protein
MHPTDLLLLYMFPFLYWMLTCCSKLHAECCCYIQVAKALADGSLQLQDNDIMRCENYVCNKVGDDQLLMISGLQVRLTATSMQNQCFEVFFTTFSHVTGALSRHVSKAVCSIVLELCAFCNPLNCRSCSAAAAQQTRTQQAPSQTRQQQQRASSCQALRWLLL